MREHAEAHPQRLYARLMGIPSERLSPGAPPSGAAPARLADVLYYAYHKGFWQFLRGAFLRPQLRRCAGRFFLGRHTRLLFPRHLSVGRNVAIGDFTYLNCFGVQGVALGDNVRLREFGWVQVTSHLNHPGHGLAVGDDTYIGPHAVLGAGGGITIGRNVMLGAYVQILAEDHAFGDPARDIDRQGVTRQGIAVGDGCWLGNGVIVLDGVRIGEHSVVGAGSVVTRDLPPHSVAVGNPARIIRERRAV
jgi:acetyltransferase-like isoleucine patch superfamily enzyme